MGECAAGSASGDARVGVDEEVTDVLTMEISREGKPVASIPLSAGAHVLGRDPSSDVVIDDKIVSRAHAKIEVTCRDGVVTATIEDLGSRNGTLVNDERVTKREIHAQDVVSIGNSRITFEGLSDSGVAGRSAGRAEAAATLIMGSLDARRVGSGEDVQKGEVSPDEARRRLALICRIAEKMCGTLTVPEIGDSFLDVLLEVFPGADRAILLLGDEREGAELAPCAMRSRVDSGAGARVSRMVVATVLKQGRSVLCGDAPTDRRFSGSQSILDLRIRSIMCAPLLASARVIGMVEVDSEHGSSLFSEEDLRLLTGLASQAAIAIENAGLYGRLEQSRRLAAIGQTVAGAAHCVKNVLNGIEGGLFIARRGLEVSDNEKAEKGWGMLERNSSFLKTMVLDMLDYSKEQVIETAETDLSALVNEVLALMEGRGAQGEIAVSAEVDPTLDRVVLDSKRIKRALVNIVGNAVEATPPGGSVQLSASRSIGDTFTICVSDTGSGIPEDALQKIFEPFYSTKGSKGTGLGLPVARKIVEEHRGRLECESTVGRGTTFRITLPLRGS